MNCRECHDKLSLYLDGQLTDEERLRVEEALERCPECVEELKVLSLLAEEMSHFEEVPIPTDLLQDLKSAFRQELVESSKSRTGNSFIKRMGSWRIAASVAALLFATWAIVEDRASHVASEKSVGQEFGGLSAQDSEQGEWGSAPLYGVGAPEEEEEVSENDDLQASPDPAGTVARSAATAVPPVANKAKKARKAFRRQVVPKSNKVGLGDDDDVDSAILAVSPTKKQYLDLMPEMRSRFGDDFRAEPWSAVGRVLDRRSKSAPRARSFVGALSKGKNMLPNPKKSKGNAEPGGGGEVVNRIKSAQVSVVSSAFFALGPHASETIKAAAKRAGLAIVPSKLGSLSKDKTNAIQGEILTIELSKNQKDALLQVLGQSKNLRIQLFGRGGEHLLRPAVEESKKPVKKISTDRKEVSKGAPAGGKKAVDRPSKQSDAKDRTKPSIETKTEPRFRLSFILLRR